MKKYFLKIGSLATFSTSLIVAISCSPELEEQSNTNLESLLTKFTSGKSTQTKGSDYNYFKK